MTRNRSATAKGSTGGGRAGQAGPDYENRVAAWFAVRVLAEAAVSLPWSLPTDAAFSAVYSQVDGPVDDVVAVTSDGGRVYVQAKHSVGGTVRDKEFGSALEQFVRQFLSGPSSRDDALKLQGRFRPIEDRLVLATADAPEKIRKHLPAVLARVREMPAPSDGGDWCVNKAEREIFEAVSTIVDRAWKDATGSLPAREELRSFLSSLWIEVLDLDAGGRDERSALETLRGSVLRQPDQASACWRFVVNMFAEKAGRRGGSDQAGLQRELTANGFQLVTTVSYRSDIDKLQRLTVENLDAMAAIGVILLHGERILVEREVAGPVRQAAEEGSVLVTGEPGAGKSVVLNWLARQLTSAGRDVVVVNIRTLGDQSLEMLRSAFGLEHSLVEVLLNWKGEGTGFIFLDGVDAARQADLARSAVENLISLVERGGSRWHIVGTVREYDLRRMGQLQRLFRGRPPRAEYADEGFSDLRHVKVPLLSDSELDQLENQAPDLRELVQTAPPRLRELLRNPLNVGLMAEVLDSGTPGSNLASVSTQIELLDNWWDRRVLRDDRKRTTRERTLEATVDAMVATRSLSVPRSDINARETDGEALEDLMSERVLAEASPIAGSAGVPLVSFAHDVLFDYVSSKVLFDGSPESVVKRLEENPLLSVFVRPSLMLYLHRLWDGTLDHAAFWDFTFRAVQSSKLGEIEKGIGPTFAIEVISHAGDWQIVVQRLAGAGEREAAAKVLLQLSLALFGTKAGAKRALIGEQAPPWSAMYVECSRHLSAHVLASMQLYLRHTNGIVGTCTSQQRRDLNEISRNVLAYAYNHAGVDPWLAVEAVQRACTTADTAPRETAEALRPIVVHGADADFRRSVLPYLGAEVRWLIPHDPELVRDIYIAAFEVRGSAARNRAESTARYNPFADDRWGHYYQLANTFDAFLTAAPQRAMEAFLPIMEVYDRERHHLASDEPAAEFPFNGRIGRLREDHSFIWDMGNTYAQEGPMVMLNALTTRLKELGEDPEQAAARRIVIDAIADGSQAAVIWRRLLTVGAQFPLTWGTEMEELAFAVPILATNDTRKAAGDFIAALYPAMSEDARRRVEEAILTVPGFYGPERADYGLHVRDRLLGCLDRNLIVTPEAHSLLHALDDRGGPPPNIPPVGPITFQSSPYDDEEYLRDEGVPVDEAANVRIRELAEPVKTFTAEHEQRYPTDEEVLAVFPHMVELECALAVAAQDGVDPKQQDLGWDVLADACVDIAPIALVDRHAELGDFLQRVLLVASAYADPTPETGSASGFDEFPSWGRPAARIPAATGLTLLAGHSAYCTPEVRDAIRRLSRDDVPAVRFQVAMTLNVLHDTAPDLMWDIFDHLSREEQSRGVLRAFISGPAPRLAHNYREVVAEAAVLVYRRSSGGKGERELIDLCLNLIVGLYVAYNDPLCESVLNAIVDAPAGSPIASAAIAADIGLYLPVAPFQTNRLEQETRRDRAFVLLERLARAVEAGLDEAYTAGDYTGQLIDGIESEPLKSLVDLAESVSRTLNHVATNLKETSDARGADVNDELSADRSKLLEMTERISGMLIAYPSPDRVRHVTETLDIVLGVAPGRIFVLLSELVAAAANCGGLVYQAPEQCARLTRRFLDENRDVLREGDHPKAFKEMIETLLRAGEVGARQLAEDAGDLLR